MPRLEFRGSYVAVVTPFDSKGRVDVEGLKLLVELHKKAGTDGIIVLGSAGESWTLSGEEKDLVVKTVVETADGYIPVVAGVTRVPTKEAAEAARQMEELGVDAVMAAAPPYVIPTQEGLYKHFLTICESVDIGVVVYNVPYRTVVSVSPEVVVRLFEQNSLAAYKEAGRDLTQLIRVVELTEGRLPVLVCDAPAYGLVMPALALGGSGTANITGNVAPREMALLSRPWDSWEGVLEARRLYLRLLPLMRAMYQETNPVAVKAVMNLVGLPAGEVRPPLLPLSREEAERAVKTLRENGLLPLSPSGNA